MRFASALIWIVAALLIACSSESTSPPPQVGNETSTDARPSVAATTTELPAVTPAAETTPTQPVPPSTMDPAEPPTTTEAPKAQPVTETAPTATPQEPTATAPTTATSRPDLPSPTPPSTALPALPTATPTPTGTATVLRVTVSAVPATLPDYDRNDWKQWTDADRDCQDARNEVLIAESRTAVAYRTDRKCRVAAGEWLAPYTNTIVTDPGRLDVDHMVPLGNAHDSGAWPMVSQSKGTLRQLFGGSPAPDRRHGRRQPLQGSTRARSMETGRPNLLVPVRHRLDYHQEHLGTDGHPAGTYLSGPDAQYVCEASGTDGIQPEPSEADTRADQQSSTTDADAGNEDVQLLRRSTGSWSNPHTGEQRQWQRLPQVDGAQCQGRRWRRRRMRKMIAAE